jgi:hypothetical protein
MATHIASSGSTSPSPTTSLRPGGQDRLPFAIRDVEQSATAASTIDFDALASYKSNRSRTVMTYSSGAVVRLQQTRPVERDLT